MLRLDRKPRVLRVALGVAAAIIVIAGGDAYMQRPPPLTSAPLGAPPTLSALQAGKDTPSGSAQTTAAAPSTVVAAPPLPPRLYAQEDEFRRLMASKEPRDNARCYQLAWECANDAGSLAVLG